MINDHICVKEYCYVHSHSYINPITYHTTYETASRDKGVRPEDKHREVTNSPLEATLA